MWARKDTGLFECPRSYISAQSIEWLEQYVTRRRLGGMRLEEMSAREAEAYLILEDLATREKEDG